MDRLFEKVHPLIIRASEQVLVGIVLAFHVIVFALLTIPESISSATSLGELVWDQFSTPSPHVPAGDLTFRLIKIWTNHVVDVELPRFRNLAARFDWKLALILRSLQLCAASLTKPLLVDRALVHLFESKTKVSGNRQDGIAIVGPEDRRVRRLGQRSPGGTVMIDLRAMPSLDELAADPSCARACPRGCGRYGVVQLAILGDALEQPAGCRSQPAEHRSWSR
jgi:hypothetical protein